VKTGQVLNNLSCKKQDEHNTTLLIYCPTFVTKNNNAAIRNHLLFKTPSG
jgi:hypothetical protein